MRSFIIDKQVKKQFPAHTKVKPTFKSCWHKHTQIADALERIKRTLI